jgi:galactoside O-acetyltransferase
MPELLFYKGGRRSSPLQAAGRSACIHYDGHIYIGDHVMIGPNVMIATANHPINPELGAKGYQYTRDVHIEENVWIGGNVSIVPGVTIGKNSVIGAGSVVTKDIPENCIAAGNPCHVIREIGPRDETYFYRDDRIDWENLR